MGTCTRAFGIVVYTEVIILDSIVSHSVVGYYYNEVVLSKKLRTAVFHDSSLSLVWRKEKQVVTSQVARCSSTGALFVSKNYLIPVALLYFGVCVWLALYCSRAKCCRFRLGDLIGSPS